MSVEATTRAWASGAAGNELLVLLAVADFAGGDVDPYDYAYPAVTTIAGRTRLSPRTVQRCLKSLVDDGRLTATGEHAWGRGKFTTQYRIEDPELPQKGYDNLTGRQSDGASPLSPNPPIGSGSSSSRSVSSSGTTSSVKGSPTATAAAADIVPDGFPDELRPHARHVMRVLVDLAKRHGAKKVTARSLGNVIMCRPRHPIVKAAHDFAAWADDQPTKRKDVLSGYRNWLEKCGELQATERIPGDPSDGPDNVARLPRRTAADYRDAFKSVRSDLDH